MFSGSGARLSHSKNEPIDNESQGQKHYLASETPNNRSGDEPAGNGLPTASRNAKSNKSTGGGRRQSEHTDKSTEELERQQLLIQDKKSNSTSPKHNSKNTQKGSELKLKSSNKKKAKLAKEETIDEEATSGGRELCIKMVLRVFKRKRIFIPLIIISYIVAIYCIPYVDIQAQIPKPLPHIPFNFRDGPLRPSSASQFKVERLFNKQVQGPESVALDSAGNMYMAIEGGFILYAHINKSSPINRGYYHYQQQQQQPSTNNRYNNDSLITTTTTPLLPAPFDANSQQQQRQHASLPNLVKIAELNGIKQLPYDHSRRKARDSATGSWRRECQLDEKAYGQSLYSGGHIVAPQSPTVATPNEIDTDNSDDKASKFATNVVVSRCSKPLGIRLSPDENYLYVVDTLSGLYRISLRVPDKPHSAQRLVNKLVDFRHPMSLMLPITQFDVPASQQQHQDQVLRAKSYMNVTLRAIDDLSIDYGAGTRGGDIIYMSLASQNWLAIGFLYDLLEGRPSGAILRYDSGSNQLSMLDPARVAHVRTSSHDLNNLTSRLYTYQSNMSSESPFYGIGAPRLDEDDVFDDRPLHFPNGLQLTDDKQAILIADTSNKRIVKHYIRGARRGTSDLWAWTPNFPDNIRRGYDKDRETYWVAGCGEDTTDKFDPLSWLNSWPMLRKYLLKQIYLVGWLIEQFGTHILRSNNVRDYGYSFKVGHALLEANMCAGMMILQYNSYGDIIRSIHSKEFPHDLAYYSQANEVIDAKNQEHLIYLSSPSYTYVTKLTFPTDSFDLPTNAAIR